MTTTMTASGVPTIGHAAFDELVHLTVEAALLGGTFQLVSWDQEVLMPPRGVAYRSRQLSQLARLHHERATDPKIADLLAACEADADLMGDPLSPQAVIVREVRYSYDRKTKLPAELVEEESRLASLGQHTWAEARKNNDFEAFRPMLEQIVDLLRRKAKCYGWADGGEAWDALAEDYEPGCTAAEVERVFTPLRDRLQGLLGDLMGSSTRPKNRFNELKLPKDQQAKFVRFVAESIGFDFERGRLDTSTHPFCSGTHCNDIRLTTRFSESNVNDALGSTMHECGHGIYEQGLLEDYVGTPMSDSVSLGIHESQSRMWENQVGRSRAFWEWCFPKLKDFFGSAVSDLTLDEVYGDANIVAPSFIRVEADEATYNMHIMVRFEIERALLRGDMEVSEIPGVWNAKYKDYLGVDVESDAVGCLQDVHWSGAAMGYFPTYTLGNLYSAQLFDAAKEAMPGLEDEFRKGEFGSLKAWLNTNIHEQGRRYRAADLCEHVTGKPLNADHLINYLDAKLRPIYGL